MFKAEVFLVLQSDFFFLVWYKTVVRSFPYIPTQKFRFKTSSS